MHETRWHSSFGQHQFRRLNNATLLRNLVGAPSVDPVVAKFVGFAKSPNVRLELLRDAIEAVAALYLVLLKEGRRFDLLVL